MELKQLRCPSCGGEVNVTTTSEMVFCNFCGNKFEVAQNSTKSPDINNYLSLAKTHADAGGFEDAINYYNKVLEIDPNHYESWIGKGFGTFFKSTLASPYLFEMVNYFEKAYQVAPLDKKDDVSSETKIDTLTAVRTFFNMANSHYIEWKSKFTDMGNLKENRDNFHERCVMIIMVIDKMLEIPENNGLISKQLCEYAIFVLINSDNNFNPSYLNQKYQEFIDKIKVIDPNYQPTLPKSGCFIATATMGDYSHPYVIALSSFRDNHLLKSHIGISFVKLYYLTSPFIAKIISKSELFRKISLVVLVKPLANFVKKF